MLRNGLILFSILVLGVMSFSTSNFVSNSIDDSTQTILMFIPAFAQVDDDVDDEKEDEIDNEDIELRGTILVVHDDDSFDLEIIDGIKTIHTDENTIIDDGFELQDIVGFVVDVDVVDVNGSLFATDIEFDDKIKVEIENKIDDDKNEEIEEENELDALKEINKANREIKKADEKISNATDNGKDTGLAELKLYDARELLEQAKISFDDGNFEDAEDLAEEAKDLASESRMKFLGKSLEEFDDEDFEEESEDKSEIEIEVEIEDGIAKIEAEFGDEKLEFEIEWIDEQITIEEIMLRTGLSPIQIESSISFEFEDLEEFDEENDKKSKQEKLADKQAKKESKLLEKQARFTEKLAEKEAKLSEKSKLSEERAYKLIQKLEEKIQKMEERLQKLLDKYESGEYFGNLKNKDSVTHSFTLSFDGTALEINDSSNVSTVNGKLFLENQVTGKHIKKFRVTGGEIFVGDSDVYDIIFGKARLTSGSGGDKNSMIVIGQVSNGVDVRTLKLNINLSESFDNDIESVNIEILSPRSKIASEWFLSGTGNLGLTESMESTESVETITSENFTSETVNSDAQIPDVDIPIITEISISTVESSYLTGDTIIISGMVHEIFENTPVIMQLISPVDLIEIAQIDVESDGVFTHTIVAQGTQWAFDGTYIIKVFYGANNVAETSFAFISKN